MSKHETNNGGTQNAHKQVKIRPFALDPSLNDSYDKLSELLSEEKPNVKGFTFVNRVSLPYMSKGSFGVHKKA